MTNLIYRPNRVIFDESGDIVAMTNESMGSGIPQLKDIQQVDFVDILYGSIDYTKYRIASINPVTKEPVLEALPVFETEEQRRIRELEDALLLQADSEHGGIL